MKTKKIFLAVALTGVMAAGCARQDVLPSGVQEFSASFADDAGTKTVLQEDGTSIYWQTSEFINIFYGDSMAGQFYSTNAEPAATATFRGNLASVAGAAGSGTDYWALYPYDAEAVCDGSSVTLTVPDSQQGMAGTFANNLFPAVAKSGSRTLQFYNVCGGARFSVTEEGIVSATFRSVGGEPLAGRVKVGFDANGKPAVTEVLDGVSEVTVAAPDGGFEVGKNYFAALLPGTFGTGIAFTFTKADGSVTTQVLNRPITIQRAVFGMLDEVEEGIWDEAHRYFTITSQADGNTISFMKQNGEVSGEFSYSLDQGVTWTSIGNWDDLAGFSYTLNNGETLSLKGDLDKTRFGYGISIPEAATVSGNIMSLVSGDGFADVTELDEGFTDFLRESAITDASKLVLPATTLADWCYAGMFLGCTSLTSAPKLPATELREACYYMMFSGCTSLTSAPELPATTLADWCYYFMFSDCTSLTSAPELPATTLADSCYTGMFFGCTSLTSAPELPATTLADGCYSGMFSGCTSLTSAPELPATTLAFGCYSSMFSGCTSLTSAPELPATTLADGCYSHMFNNCSNLSYVKALFTTTPSDDYTKEWLAGVAETGTFEKAPEATWNVIGPNGIPEGWTVVGGTVPVESVSLDKTSLSLMQGTGAVLTATVSPDNATDPSVSWTSSNEGIVAVDQTGKLLARGIGSATVTVTTTDGAKTATCAVTVTEAVPGQMYFTITSETTGNTITFTQLEEYEVPAVDGSFWYSLDGGATWTSIGAWSELAGFSQTLGRNESLLLKGELDKTCFGYKIGIPKAATVSGNIMSLVSGDGFASVTELDAKYAFYSIFNGTAVTDASRLVLPATRLTEACYSNMFYDCTGLMSTPALPATDLAVNCYFSMFQNCVRLGSAPVLPATTMATASYGMMFYGCKQLTTAPELPATALADHCYFGMFWECSNLTTAPELPVTELADYCYHFMFFRCSSLVSAPELPATTLAAGCYERMFSDCTNLSYVKALFTTTPSDEYTPDWLSGVAPTGTFVKSLDATWNVIGTNGVPEGWTIETVEGTASGSSPEGIGYEEW